MSAFVKNQRVRMSAKALRQGLQGRQNKSTGIVVSASTPRGLIRVLVDGRKSVETYHPSFWEPEVTDAAELDRIPAATR